TLLRCSCCPATAARCYRGKRHKPLADRRNRSPAARGAYRDRDARRLALFSVATAARSAPAVARAFHAFRARDGDLRRDSFLRRLWRLVVAGRILLWHACRK